MGVLLLLITTICAVTSRYRSDCTDVLFELAPCLDYVTDASTCPSLDCCKQFTNVIKTRPLCLCAVFDGTASKLLGVPIDTDRAINLPEACQEEEEEEELSQALPTCKCSCRISFYQTLACVGTNSSTFITESSSSSKKSSPCRATTCWNSMRRW